jgi:hypothetical protein
MRKKLHPFQMLGDLGSLFKVFDFFPHWIASRLKFRFGNRERGARRSRRFNGRTGLCESFAPNPCQFVRRSGLKPALQTPA